MYTRAEWLYQVHGVDGEDPTEGHYSRQYAWPPVSHEPRIQEISDALAARAANSAAILLRSPSDRHPEGLANGSGQVGRNYMYHNSKAVVALGKERNDTVFEKTLGLNDFYLRGRWPRMAARQHPDVRGSPTRRR